MENNIKNEFENFYNQVSDLTLNLIEGAYKTQDTYLQNYNFVKEKLLAFNEKTNKEEMKILAMEHPNLFIDWTNISTCIASIENCLQHLKLK
ncbi:hypothetical protein [Erwinia mallotivora]|uniref:Uncharacterized protein n=1 Tax=Erwinia mallotivora TaxID=69222 RepID=A0A014M714_9GAMM|nr:hypothetical protein [Erwinia mallotivora]EXU73879.1 hypothetical protein BG55_20460 [Erwinia mallotivora]